MKRIYILFAFLFTSLVFGQNTGNPLVILDSKNIGYMDQAESTLKLINPNDLTVFIYKGSAEEVLQKFGSKSGVLIFASKKYILDTFYKNNIENSPLKKDIPTTDYLSKVGILESIPDNKNPPYDDLVKYINITPIIEDVKKITSITFIKPVDSQKINPAWKLGALDINSAVE